MRQPPSRDHFLEEVELLPVAPVPLAVVVESDEDGPEAFASALSVPLDSDFVFSLPEPLRL